MAERRRPGPQPLPAHLRRTSSIRVAVTDSERAEIEGRALAAGLTVSEYLRTQALTPSGIESPCIACLERERLPGRNYCGPCTDRLGKALAGPRGGTR